MGAALGKQTGKLDLAENLLNKKAAGEFGKQIGLHAAVARSIALHLSVGGVWALPTKAGVLDWSFADAMQPLQQRVGASARATACSCGCATALPAPSARPPWWRWRFSAWA